MFSLIMTWQQLVILRWRATGPAPLPRWIKNKKSREKTPSGYLGYRLILLCSLATRAEQLSQVLGPTRKRMKIFSLIYG